ncbi:hypothetical protein DT603_03535 [Pseudoxanthomonas gei]|uniref:Uncharacterized protein n=1 Tax=Pseudoxanthomonas gei TaxID=1383030 RepID=A0ABX0A8Q9_9GAMM|nr:hypothetical protein [Pseudoxanthomonas gei]NDK37910.1 hypothetical protein [Pseudoxanthomonas gei]
MDKTTEEIICDLQAQVYVLRAALRALAQTHRDSNELLKAWREALENSTAGPVVPAYARQSEYIAERCQAFVEDWTAELVELAVPGVKRRN